MVRKARHLLSIPLGRVLPGPRDKLSRSTFSLNLFLFELWGKMSLIPWSHKLKSHIGMGLPRAIFLLSTCPHKSKQGLPMEMHLKATFGFLHSVILETNGLFLLKLIRIYFPSLATGNILIMCEPDAHYPVW